MTTQVPANGAADRPSTAWNVGLWIAQVLLAGNFAIAGFMKLTQPIAQLADALVWPGDIPAWLVRFIAVAELLGAIGVILPAATRVKPGLTPLAAAGLATVMLLAVGFHAMRGEPAGMAITFSLGLLAAVVAWGRWRKAPIRPRG